MTVRTLHGVGELAAGDGREDLKRREEDLDRDLQIEDGNVAAEPIDDALHGQRERARQTYAERSDVEPANARTEQAGDELVVQHATGDDRARKVDDRASLVVSKVRATDDAPPCRAG